jgi:hypothetical protein
LAGLGVLIASAAGIWIAASQQDLRSLGRQVVVSIPSGGRSGNVVDNIIATVVVSFIVLNYRAIWRFLRRTVRPTDQQIVGEWWVYRFVKKYGRTRLAVDRWIIERDLYSNYNVRMERLRGEAATYSTTRGRLVYNERDRFNILVTGINHQQQSLVSFESSIPRDKESGILGLGLGDDAEYNLSLRVYLAYRYEIPEQHARDVLEYASELLNTANEDAKFVQLTRHMVSRVFEKYPPPGDCTEQPLARHPPKPRARGPGSSSVKATAASPPGGDRTHPGR